MSMLVRLGGKYAQVSDFAGKILRYQDSCGIYKAKNGFVQRLAKYYPDPQATLTVSSKNLKDGRYVKQNLWSWPDGATVALTEKSDGFFSLVSKNSSGEVTRSLVSKNANDLVHKEIVNRMINGKLKSMPFETHVNGDYIAKFLNGKLDFAKKDLWLAENWVKDAIADARSSFANIG